MQYYLSHHWPLVNEKWGPHGLLNWNVIQLSPNPGGSDLPYKVEATLIWRDKESFTTLMAMDEWKIVFDDVPNFCNEMPMMLTGDVVGSG